MAIKVGGTTVVDDTRQLSNIASVDAATVTALSDAGVGGGGGSFDMTATGAITAGDVVALNSNGTVSTVVNQAGDPATLLASGTNTSLTQKAKFPSSAVDDARQRVVRVYADTNNNNYATAVCGQIDTSGNITWGTPVVFLSQNVDSDFAVVYNESDNFYYIFCKRPSDSRPLVTYISNPSSTTLSFISNLVDSGGYGNLTSEGYSGVYDPDQQRVIFVWYGTDFGEGIAASFHNGGLQGHTSFASYEWPQYADITYDTVNNKVVHFTQFNQNNTLMARVMTVSASSISVGSGVSTGAQGGVMPRCTFDPDSGKVITVAVRASQGGVVYYSLGTVSGTTSSWTTGSTTAVSADDVESGYDLTYDTGADKVVFSYKAVGNPQIIEAVLGTVSGSTLTFSSTPVEIYSAYARYSRVEYLPTSGYFVWTASDNSNNLAYATASVIASTNSDWFGIADASISSGSTGAITHIGGINESVSGLTAGTTYYADKVGGLSATDSGFKVGKAIAADKILITEGNA
jgi:hypothetical protein